MTNYGEFSFDLVKQFLINRGGKVTNPELVKHFRHYLNDPVHKDEIRLKFKDYVNRLACVKEQNGVKYLLLRNEYVDELCTMPPDVPPPPYTPARVEPDLCAAGFSRQETPCLGYSTPLIGPTPQTPQWRQFSPQEDIMVANECPSLALARAPHNRSSPCLLEDVRSYEDIPPPLPKKKHSLNGSPTRPEVPLPPPRGRKSHGRRGSQVEERVRQFSAEKELEGSPNFKEKSVQDVAVSPGTVKEKTQIINRMSESNLLTKVAAGPGGGPAAKRRDGPGARAAADDDTTSLNTLDPRRREWILRAAQADYHSLVRLLREDPDLYRFEDFTSGYTALHWAAKHGSSEMVKLIAGTHRLNPNVKSHGGYTPLHLASMFQKQHIIELLLHTYGADPNVRDHSGRKPAQYLNSSAQASKTSTNHKSFQQPSRSSEKDAGFMRMGSFNSRVKRTAAVLTYPFGVQKLKPWGSADSVTDVASSTMPPPKGLAKKKKSKKVLDFPSSSSMDSMKSKLSLTPSVESDSDSAYGFAP